MSYIIEVSSKQLKDKKFQLALKVFQIKNFCFIELLRYAKCVIFKESFKLVKNLKDIRCFKHRERSKDARHRDEFEAVISHKNDYN